MPDRVIQSGLVAASRVAAKHAAQPDYAFRDQTGRLRKTIKAKTATSKFRHAGTVRYAKVTFGGPGARQSNLIELGSHKMKARAPIRKAVHETLANAFTAMQNAMDRRLKQLSRDARNGELRLTQADFNASQQESQF